MAKAFFSRRVPFGLLPADENNDFVSFDAYEVEADPATVRMASELRAVLANAEDMYMNMPAPEEASQTEADYMVAQLSSIATGWKNGN